MQRVAETYFSVRDEDKDKISQFYRAVEQEVDPEQ